MKTSVPYNPAVLEAAARQAGEGVWQQFPALDSWIKQEKSPTLLQLSEFARKVHIPFGYFFLEQLPEAKNTVPFFRKGKSRPVYTYSAELAESIRTIERRLNWIEEYVAQEGEAPLRFIGSLNTEMSAEKAAVRMRQDLRLPLDWMKQTGTQDPLKRLRDAAEAAGIFIAKNGIVGNNGHAALNPEEFRGFTLVGQYTAYVFLNIKAPVATHLFTLAHELVHVWLGRSAVSDSDGIALPENTMEQWCDAVAAELLVPEKLLAEDWEHVKNNRQDLKALSKIYKANEVILARRLLDTGKYDENRYWSFINTAKQGWHNGGSGPNEKEHKSGNYYNNQNNRVGKSFYHLVDSAVKAGKLLYTDAYRLTGLYGSTYENYGKK